MRGSTGKRSKDKTGRRYSLIVKKGGVMCLSTVYKYEVSDANMLAKNVADVRIENGQILFTDLMGIRTVFDGTLEKVDLMDNYIIVKDR